MIAYAPAKINIGLKILSKRTDGFHNLHSYFYPVPLYDLMEFKESNQDQLTQSGWVATPAMEDNLIYKALCLLRNNYEIPPLHIHLHKQIPFQAGLGGGSADAVTFLKELIRHFGLPMNEDEIFNLSLKLGSDCPFFVKSTASDITGRGDIVRSIPWSLKGIYITIVKAPISIKTSEAFSYIIPNDDQLSNILSTDHNDYQKAFPNQFENFIFEKYPEIAAIKQKLIQSGAFYASLSGSGSSVFGLSYNNMKISLPASYFLWNGVLQ
jgi:4-diphosphocytidyl-2-C-methyl-D-erythritol kinase